MVLRASQAVGELSITEPSFRMVSSATIPVTLANCLQRTDSAASQIMAVG